MNMDKKEFKEEAHQVGQVSIFSICSIERDQLVQKKGSPN